MKSEEQNTLQRTPQKFPVVGIGASAGGLDAFRKLLQAIPEDSGMAYVIVQHLSPDYDSRLTEILAQSTTIPVYEIINNINLAPNHIYVIPENNNLISYDGVLQLEKRSRNKLKNDSIDIFFESLAEVHKSFAIGVILSGTAYDGTFGLKKIKEQGGATIAQEPETAVFKGMPQSAIEAEAVDFVLAPENIPTQLLKIYNSYEVNHGYNEEENLPVDEDEIFKKIINIVFLRSGNDFRHYKQATLRRRIARRMVNLKKDGLEDYYNALRNDKAEQDLLFNDLLIPVTYFFRDSNFFESLPKTVFPKLVQNAADNNLRIWVAGCATGEEAYSLAICLHEFLTKNNLREIRVKIFASDISEKCITKARTAIYSPQDIQQISESRIHNYFTKRDGHYHINKVIRDMCVFAVHNFIKDPPFSKIDLVSCRNVLIYFDAHLQHKVLTSFHYSLKEKGFLFLGKSETAANVQNLFESFDRNEKIYSRKHTTERYIPEPYREISINGRKVEVSGKKQVLETDYQKIAPDVLFTKYIPTGTAINEYQEIVNGDTSSFLSPSHEKSSLNTLKIARGEIGFEIQDAVLKSPKVEKNSKLKRKSTDQQRITDLESELLLLREDIKRITEKQQTAFEKLQTTNEELLNSSEELQVINEELETSTEELQSNNEELMCVNDELMDRQEQLISLRNYSEFIVKTIREPLIIIDKHLFVKSANPAFYKYFNTTERETEDYSFFEIGNCQWNIPEFKELLHKMLDGKVSIEDFKVSTYSKGIGKKIIMVNAHRIIDTQHSGLILLALEDITELESTAALLTEANNTLKRYNEELKLFSSAASHDLQEPLRKVLMFCKRILDDDKEKLSESTLHNVHRILFSTANMSQLVADLINYTQIELKEKEYKRTDLNVLIKKAVQDMKDIITQKNAVIDSTNLPQLTVIPYQMQQLFTNVISNAVKYSKPDVQPEIKIEARQATAMEIEEIKGDPDISYSKIIISDNGIGFGKEYENRVFDPFYRLHSQDEYPGSGIGLTLSKKIVENHKGFITASGEVNKGTTINLYLPQQ